MRGESGAEGRRVMAPGRAAVEHPPTALADVAALDLRVLFVGINPSTHSARAGHHFATRGNSFWRLLHASGLTPVLLRPEEDRRLLEFRLGMTSGCPRPTGAASELSRAEQVEGARLLLHKLERLRPRFVALLGLTLYRVVVPGGDEPGPGLKAAPLAGARLFVLPNPSGRNRAYPGFEKKLAWFRRLAELVD